MSIFGKILSKLGFGDDKAAPSAPKTSSTTQSTSTAPSQAPTQSRAITQVDVAAQLEKMASANPEKLNWKTSIVDLLKLLGIDSSLTARKELATELHVPQEKMSDSAQMNIWLHKVVMQKLAENGGKVPAELLS
ncbi:MAG TPA: DUF3597 domain-containing protein [Steroidobacteraceae bacterium]|nr:DUF3597 domain-containing protein [Steroidobacteraceae bacterium]